MGSLIFVTPVNCTVISPRRALIEATLHGHHKDATTVPDNPKPYPKGEYRACFQPVLVRVSTKGCTFCSTAFLAWSFACSLLVSRL